MRLGLGPIDLARISPRELRALAEAAVAASFDCVWVGGAGGALAAAAMVAQWVPVRVGAVADVGTYHPLHLAEDIAVADLTCAGRLEVLLRPANVDADVLEEHLEVLAMALSGAHLQWNGKHLRVPARLADNGPVPERLALNPRPMQPAVPVWVLGRPAARGLPQLVLCPAGVTSGELLAAAGDNGGYFLVDAATPDEVRSAGRRLAGPLRMPEFPAWVNE